MYSVRKLARGFQGQVVAMSFAKFPWFDYTYIQSSIGGNGTRALILPGSVRYEAPVSEPERGRCP